MARKGGDQAEGLRRMRVSDAIRVITVTGGRTGVGKTSTVVNLAAALAGNGRRVLVVDENPRHNNVNASLGLKARYDLLHVIERDKTLEQVIVPGPEGVSILPAMRGVESLAKLGHDDEERLVRCFSRLARPVDVVLVDTTTGGASPMLSSSLAAQQVLIVLSAAASSITDAYALIKLMSQEYAKRHFLVLLNKIGSEQEARTIFDNVSQVSRRHLSVALEFAGCIPRDEKLHRATQLCRSVVEAFPASASAAGFRKLADSLLRCLCPADDGGGVEGFMQRLIHNSRLGFAHSVL